MLGRERAKAYFNLKVLLFLYIGDVAATEGEGREAQETLRAKENTNKTKDILFTIWCGL